MKVDVAVYEIATEGVDLVSEALGNMSVTEMLAHKCAVLGLARPLSLLCPEGVIW